MSKGSLRIAQRLWRLIASRQLPLDLAMGAAIGMAVGLLPKDNPLWIGLVALALFVRMNHAIAVTIVCILAGIGMPCDRITHPVGQWALELTPLQPLWENMAAMPFLPWLGWNNSAVMGSCLISFSSGVSIYGIVRWLTRHSIRSQSEDRMERIVDEARDYRLSVEERQRQKSIPEELVIPVIHRRKTNKRRMAAHRRIDPERPSDSSTPNMMTERAERIAAEALIGDATDGALEAMHSEMPMPQVSTFSDLPTADPQKTDPYLNAMPSGAVLRETLIEVVRFRSKSDASDLPNQAEPSLTHTPRNADLLPMKFDASEQVKNQDAMPQTMTSANNPPPLLMENHHLTSRGKKLCAICCGI